MSRLFENICFAFDRSLLTCLWIEASKARTLLVALGNVFQIILEILVLGNALLVGF